MLQAKLLLCSQRSEEVHVQCDILVASYTILCYGRAFDCVDKPHNQMLHKPNVEPNVLNLFQKQERSVVDE